MVENNKFVMLHYTGSFDDGEVFDSSIGGQPLEFQVGAGMVIPGLDKAVVGMKIDEEKEIKIEPAEAYGEYDESRKNSYPLADIKQNFEPEVGMTIGIQMENGMQMPAQIAEITDTEVLIDMNHPLAGKTLNFKIQVLEINDEAKLTGGCSCSGCDDDSGCDEPGSGCGSSGSCC